MYSNGNWIPKFVMAVFATAALATVASAQVQVWAQVQSLLPPDEARDIFNAGQRFYDESRFTDAESKFREVVRRFPKNAIADRADYYLIRTLAQVNRKTEALSRIDGFAKQYPKSRWFDDVQELRIQLTNQIPERGEDFLLRVYPSPAPGFGRTVQFTVPPAPPVPPVPPVPTVAPMPPGSFSFINFQNADPEISLQQEIMQAIFRNNADRAIEIATERLKANPADPVVLSSLNMVAASRSAQATPMLLAIAKNSTNARARRDAIFWLGQSRGDKDALVDTLVGLIPTLAEEDSEAVTYALSQVRTEKSFNALATIARDKSKGEKARNNALYWIGQSRTPNRVPLLEDIYKNSMDNSKLRQQVTYALNQTREPQAVTVLGNIALTDPDIEVRKQAVYWLGQNRSAEASQALERLLQKK